MDIKLAKSDVEIALCFPVMHELRPRVGEGAFVSRVRRQEASGYRLAYVLVGGEAVAVAGYRVGETWRGGASSTSMIWSRAQVSVRAVTALRCCRG